MFVCKLKLAPQSRALQKTSLVGAGHVELNSPATVKAEPSLLTIWDCFVVFCQGLSLLQELPETVRGWLGSSSLSAITRDRSGLKK